MNAHNEQQAAGLLALGLDEFGYHTEAANVRKGIDLVAYKADLWAIRAALDTQPGAAQEAVGWQWRWLDTDNTWSEWTDGGSRKEIDARIARWKADGEDHRMQVRPVFAAPVTAAPADTWFADQLTAMGEVIPLDSTPASPGIDAVLEVVARYVGRTSNVYRYITKDLRELIDASPKCYDVYSVKDVIHAARMAYRDASLDEDKPLSRETVMRLSHALHAIGEVP